MTKKIFHPTKQGKFPPKAGHTQGGSVLMHPVTTEKAIGMIELENKLLFAVQTTATKPQIKNEIEKMFKVKVASVNTKIKPNGQKQAYIKLKEGKADDIAAQLKII